MAKKFTPKFSDTEKMLLLSIIDDVKEIVESTKTDGPSVEEKKATWRLIAEQYADSASSSGLPVRTEAQLKRCWINLKFRYFMNLFSSLCILVNKNYLCYMTLIANNI